MISLFTRARQRRDNAQMLGVFVLAVARQDRLLCFQTAIDLSGVPQARAERALQQLIKKDLVRQSLIRPHPEYGPYFALTTTVLGKPE